MNRDIEIISVEPDFNPILFNTQTFTLFKHRMHSVSIFSLLIPHSHTTENMAELDTNPRASSNTLAPGLTKEKERTSGFRREERKRGRKTEKKKSKRDEANERKRDIWENM